MLHLAPGQPTGAVAEHELLAGSDASHRGGVEAFVAVDDGQVASIGQCVNVEQRRHHLRGPRTPD
jgi:hypothetical protein